MKNSRGKYLLVLFLVILLLFVYSKLPKDEKTVLPETATSLVSTTTPKSTTQTTTASKKVTTAPNHCYVAGGTTTANQAGQCLSNDAASDLGLPGAITTNPQVTSTSKSSQTTTVTTTTSKVTTPIATAPDGTLGGDSEVTTKPSVTTTPSQTTNPPVTSTKNDGGSNMDGIAPGSDFDSLFGNTIDGNHGGISDAGDREGIIVGH